MSSADFIPIRIGTLRASEPVTFDIFIKIGDRHVHYLMNNDPFDEDRLRSLKSKGVKKLFVPRDSELFYLSYLEAGFNTLKDSSVKLSDRAELANEGMVTAAEKASENIKTERGFKSTENQLSKISSFLMSEKGAMKQMLTAGGIATDNSQHSANVVTLSVQLGSKCKLGENELLLLGTAALLHDIGKEDLKIDPMMPRESMSAAQLTIYHTHPAVGMAKLQDKPYINKAILDLIGDHEEVGDAAGFPNKKRLIKLPLAQQILNLCNEYDRVCTVNKVKPMEAMKMFYMDKLGMFDLKLLEKFRDVIKTG